VDGKGVARGTAREWQGGGKGDGKGGARKWQWGGKKVARVARGWLG